MAQANQPSITRRMALSTLLVVAAVATFPGVVASRPAPAAEAIAAFNALPPMKRLFLHQQMSDWVSGDTEYRNIFRDKLPYERVQAEYEEWLAGFDKGVIDAFEGGKWAAPRL